jgi:RNA polymerase sigma factor (sigma-70 family)
MLSFFRKKNYHDSSNEELLAHYRTSMNQEILGVLYERNLAMVYGVCIKYFEDKELAQDAVMDIFEQLNEKIKHHDIAKFDGWLYMLAKNHCLMQLRKKAKSMVTSLDERQLSDGEEIYTEHDSSKEEKLNSLESCIEKLPEEQKIAVKMFYLEEKSYKDIAEKMNIDLEKVRSFIQNGRRNLKICMQK